MNKAVLMIVIVLCSLVALGDACPPPGDCGGIYPVPPFTGFRSAKSPGKKFISIKQSILKKKTSLPTRPKIIYTRERGKET